MQGAQEINNMEYTMKDIIKSFDILDWCMMALIIALLAIAHWYAYQYDIPHLLSGVVIGIPIGALAMGLGMSARDHKRSSVPRSRPRDVESKSRIVSGRI